MLFLLLASARSAPPPTSEVEIQRLEPVTGLLEKGTPVLGHTCVVRGDDASTAPAAACPCGLGPSLPLSSSVIPAR